MSIDHFIEKRLFTHNFQPIYQLHNHHCLGFEALMRPFDLPNPELAFEAAKRAGRSYDLDTASIDLALQAYRRSGLNNTNAVLFVNVLPSTLISPNFSAFITHTIHTNQLRADQIVLEISESEQMDQLLDSFYLIQKLINFGIKFALDDVGKGYSNFDVMISFPFNYIKLDRLFSTQLHLSGKKMALIQLFRDYCESQNIQLVLEGLETRQEYALAIQLGVENAQGYYLGRPAAIDDVKALM